MLKETMRVGRGLERTKRDARLRGHDAGLLKIFGCGLFLALVSTTVMAQEAPTPRSAPRTPVKNESVAERKTPPREVEGQALAIDGERLRISGVDVRLFGIVPPQLSASFGPQARAALDGIITGQNINCRIRDRDSDKRLLASCVTTGGVDPALELLRRGLAVAARGSLADSEFAPTYIAAENAAHDKKVGLWSVAMAAPVAMPKVEIVKPVEPPKAEPVKTDAPKADSVKADAPKTDSVAKDAKIASMISVPVVKAGDEGEGSVAGAGAAGFVARYQILIAGLLMLVTGAGIFTAVTLARRNEKREEMKALAAALRGELQAARAVCLTRIKTIHSDAEDRATTWPRMRSTLYQAYVGKLGRLGSELARQVASIYGQASDYAAYYGAAGEGATVTPKKQALQLLVTHIDEVLPRLYRVEQTGSRAMGGVPAGLVAPVMAAVAPVAVAEAAAGLEAVPSAPSANESPLWNVVRGLRNRGVATSAVAADEDGDYTALIEEEMHRISFAEEDETHPLDKTGSV